MDKVNEVLALFGEQLELGTIGQESFACCPCGEIHLNASLLL